jgi:hypothetical protein
MPNHSGASIAKFIADAIECDWTGLTLMPPLQRSRKLVELINEALDAWQRVSTPASFEGVDSTFVGNVEPHLLPDNPKMPANPNYPRYVPDEGLTPRSPPEFP